MDHSPGIYVFPGTLLQLLSSHLPTPTYSFCSFVKCCPLTDSLALPTAEGEGKFTQAGMPPGDAHEGEDACHLSIPPAGLCFGETTVVGSG